MSENLNGDIDRWIEWIKDCKYLPETDFKQLCTIISDIFFEESNVQPIFFTSDYLWRFTWTIL